MRRACLFLCLLFAAYPFVAFQSAIAQKVGVLSLALPPLAMGLAAGLFNCVWPKPQTSPPQANPPSTLDTGITELAPGQIIHTRPDQRF